MPPGAAPGGRRDPRVRRGPQIPGTAVRHLTVRAARASTAAQSEEPRARSSTAVRSAEGTARSIAQSADRSRRRPRALSRRNACLSEGARGPCGGRSFSGGRPGRPAPNEPATAGATQIARAARSVGGDDDLEGGDEAAVRGLSSGRAKEPALPRSAGRRRAARLGERPSRQRRRAAESSSDGGSGEARGAGCARAEEVRRPASLTAWTAAVREKPPRGARRRSRVLAAPAWGGGYRGWVRWGRWESRAEGAKGARGKGTPESQERRGLPALQGARSSAVSRP